MAKFDPQKHEDPACLGAALTACALGLMLESILSPGVLLSAAMAVA
tara:strand:- start:1622 stop:1759 length:138 start_codon:yes stop_codon:yes gene_type:complete